jgi:hypothetical protein
MSRYTYILAILLFCTPALSQRLKIGMNFESPPFCFITEAKDTAGLEYDIAIGLAKHIAHSKQQNYFFPQFVNVASPSEREQLLALHQVDFIIDRYSVTPDRRKKILFSTEYHVNPKPLAKLSHLNPPLASIGFLRTSTADAYVKTSPWQGPGEGSKTLVSEVDQKKLLQMFFDQKIGAIVDDREFLDYWHSHTKDFTTIETLDLTQPDTFAIAISSRHAQDTAIVNQYVNSLWGTSPTSGNIVRDDMYQEHRSKKPLAGTIKYPVGKSYNVIVPVFLGIPIVVTIILIVFGKYTGTKPRDARAFELSDSPVNFAWIIANSRYDHKEGLKDHPYTDAIKLQQALQKYSFPESHVAIQRDATRKGIIKTLQDISNRNENADVPFSKVIKPKDHLLIYFSGHGEKIQIGPLQVGFWVPVDGSASWDFIPDYEVKSMLAVLGVKNVLLISDSCFSGTLLNGNVNSVNGSGQYGDERVDIITSGNNRVPMESIFSEKLTSFLTHNPKESLCANDLYVHLRSELTNHPHYRPQFGSLSNGSSSTQFTFSKTPLATPVTPNDAKPDAFIRLLALFSEERRFISYTQLRASCQMDEKSFAETIARMQEMKLVMIRSNNSIFITTNGLSYGKQRQSVEEVGI